MTRRTWFLLAGATVALLAVVAALRQNRAPDPPADYDVDAPGAIRLTVARMEEKNAIARRLVAGRLSLPEAAAAFRDLDAGDGVPSIRYGFPAAASDEEAYCRSVIGYAAKAAPPDQAAELTRRLNDELDAHLRDGTLRLPDPSP